MRHRLCDCVLGVRSPIDGQDPAPKETIVAHRAVLAGWPYFAALFRHTEPAAWEPPAEDDPKGPRRPLYDIAVPFAPGVLCALVETAYHDHEHAHLVDVLACDPVDAIRCAIFLGEKEPAIRGRIARVLEALGDPRDPDRAGRDRDLATFVRHMIDASLTSALKDSLVARYHYLFKDDAEFAHVGVRDGALEMPYAHSDPPPHGVHLYCDSISAPPTTHRLVRGTMCDLEIAAEFRPKVVDASQAVEIHARPSKGTTGMWQMALRLFHPFGQIRAASFTVRIHSAWSITLRDDTEGDVPSIVGSSLTACEIVLFPVAPAL
ncbi:Btb/poz domain-containing protein [Pandoravirus kuranda]|uniref:Btb/poz domain-containing protein n=1 Tax=Pandoravirus kuranda TaxID=3019033 RepID=A0AA95J3Y5_9VIRU|nr:Btb/poz domain-containing protein [Pandoravirus kuranda]